MKIIQLEYFCAVSRFHSITQAAQHLYVTPPAISSAIKELEKEFSISLFTRSKNHVTLTKEGELFYQKAANLLQTINQTTSEFMDLGKQAIPIKVGIPPLLSTIFFPEMLIAFQNEYPDIPVELYEYGSLRAAKLVQEDALDLALVNMNFYELDKLNSYRILSDKIVFCVSKNHPLAKETSITVELLKDEPLMMYNSDSVQNSTLNELFEAAGIKPNIIMQASQLYTIRNFISHNLGGACIYSSLLANMPEFAGIPIMPTVEQEIGIVWPKGKYLSSRVEKFINFTKKHAPAVTERLFAK
ncbi:DNA-binding transcriptional LysR family regulator [Lachnospiraceae bacterium PFB1-21]|uniref:LysR family transcriptional regulator n=1 Tax=Ohessyouella blattaphilus TaxID=2949333 RepID=UPI003E23B796